MTMTPATDHANTTELGAVRPRRAPRGARVVVLELVDRVRGIFAELVELDKLPSWLTTAIARRSRSTN